MAFVDELHNFKKKSFQKFHNLSDLEVELCYAIAKKMKNGCGLSQDEAKQITKDDLYVVLLARLEFRGIVAGSYHGYYYLDPKFATIEFTT